MKNKFLVGTTVLSVLLVLSFNDASAQHQQRTPASEYKSGIGKRESSGFSGPTSVEFDLEENDRKKKPAFEFPSFDRFLAPWFAWKGRLSQKRFCVGRRLRYGVSGCQ